MMLTICPAVCALTMLAALADAACCSRKTNASQPLVADAFPEIGETLGDDICMRQVRLKTFAGKRRYGRGKSCPQRSGRNRADVSALISS
jgi:hypothetical protein